MLIGLLFDIARRVLNQSFKTIFSCFNEGRFYMVLIVLIFLPCVSLCLALNLPGK